MACFKNFPEWYLVATKHIEFMRGDLPHGRVQGSQYSRQCMGEGGFLESTLF